MMLVFAVEWCEPTATDNCTPVGSLLWTKSHLPGEVFPVGITTVTYTVTDTALNISNECSFTVTVNATLIPVATFSYPGTPYCPNASNPSPVFSGGGIAGTFSSTAGLVFTDISTGVVNVAASTPGDYIVTNTITGPDGCWVVTETSPFSISSEYSWTGAVSTDWNVAGNWSCGLLPGTISSAIIPNVPNKPVLNSAGCVKNLTIAPGSRLTVSGSLQISGIVSNNGIFDATNGKIELNGTVLQTISGDLIANSVKDLTINNLAGVTIQSSLKVSGILYLQSGDLASDGNLTLVSTASGTAFIDGSGTGQVIGNVTMQRYLDSGFGYKYFSSPFVNATVAEFGDDMDLASPFTPFYAYDENRLVGGIPASGWVNYKVPTNVLNPVAGYAVNLGNDASVKTIDVTGPVNNGNLSVTLYNHNHPYTKGFNLVGNPYPSAIDWNALDGWTKTNIDNALYFFRAGTTDQYGGTYSSYNNGVSSDGVASNIIPSMQGFFVHVSDGTYPVEGTLSMNNLVRVGDMTHQFMKSASKNSNDSKGSEEILRLSAAYSDNITLDDPMVIYSDDKATLDFDGPLDALKFFNTDQRATDFYCLGNDGSKMSINAIPAADGNSFTIPLGIRTRKSGEVIFKVRDVAGAFMWENVDFFDALTGESTDVVTGMEYRIYLDAGTYNSRFFLNFADFTTQMIEQEVVSHSLLAFMSKDKLNVEINGLQGEEGILSVIDITGHKYLLKKIFENGHYEFDLSVKDGIYIVSFISGDLRISKKIVIHNR